MRSAFDHWQLLWHELSAQGDPRPLHQRLVAAYNEPTRHYHNLQHLDECLAELAGESHTLTQPAWVAAAVWFHDAVYDSHSSTNEADSAALAGQVLTEARISPEAIVTIQRLILCTKTHDPADVPDAAALVDIDLAILGQPAERFWDYERAIRAEYAWVPWDKYVEGRSTVLTRFLQRPAIYRTEPFRARYEVAARKNLAAAIAALKSRSVE